MGFFRKKRNKGSEDFILDFTSMGDTVHSETIPTEQNADGENDLTLPSWEERKKKHAPHAMTVGEILGTFSDSENESGSVRPKEQIRAEELGLTENKAERESETVTAETEAEQKTGPTPEEKKDHDDRKIEVHKASISVPEEAKSVSDSDKVSQKTETAAAKESAPTEAEPETNAEKTEVKVESEPVEVKAETETYEKSESEREAKEFIESLKEKSFRKIPSDVFEKENTETEPATEIKVTDETEVKEPVKESGTQATDSIEEEKPEVSATHDIPAPDKKEIKLSPAAQVLYDRMMAQRAKRQAQESLHTETEQPNDAIGTKNEENAGPFKTDGVDAAKCIFEPYIETAEQDNTEPLGTDITPAPAEPETAPDSPSAENISDSIFAELSKSLKNENPLLRKKQNSADSLLSICKNYITPTEENAAASIDSIIHSAEKGARERLRNFYNVQNSEIPHKPSAAFDPAMFTRDKSDLSADEAERSVSVPVKIIDESSDKAIISGSTGEIKNFQCSFADSSADEPEDTCATRIIDFVPTGESAPQHRTDPAKMEAIKLHLDALAEREVEDIPEVHEKVKFTGVDEAELPENDVSSFEEEDISADDYSSPEDENRVRTDLASKKVGLTAKLLSTSVITVALAVIDFGFKQAIIASSPMTYSLLNILLLVLAMLINYNTLKGFANLILSSPDMDSPCALGVTAAFIATLVTAVTGSDATAPSLAPIAAIALLFNLIGKYSMLTRIRRGFEVIVGSEHKKAVTFVEDKLKAAVMANGAVIGEALICNGKETQNVTDYLKNSYSEDPYEKKLKPILIFTVIAAFVFALLGFAFGGFITSVAAFALVTLLVCPPTVLLCSALPLGTASKHLFDYGAMIAGFAGAEAIANANAVAFDANELFPVGTVKLYNMQVLNKGAIDKYLTYATAVLTAAKSPLCPIFEEMIAESGEKLPTADSVKYENTMGISGWIGDHRVFIGNRTLMEGHNIRVPSLELDKKVLRAGYFPVYLAFDQQLCALFIVGYEADETITYELRRLCSTGVTMLVSSNDANITEEMLCDYFGLYPDSIKIMSASGVGSYKSETEYRESVSAPASFKDGICGFLAIVTSAIRIKSITDILMIVQLVGVILSLALCGYLLITGVLSTLPAVYIALFQLILTAIIKLISSFYQP